MYIDLSSEAKGGGLEEGGLDIGRGRRSADDGKRFEAMDVVVALLLGRSFFLSKMGRGSGGRGGKNSTVRKSGGIFFNLS